MKNVTRRKQPLICIRCRAAKVIGQDRCVCGSVEFSQQRPGLQAASQAKAKNEKGEGK